MKKPVIKRQGRGILGGVGKKFPFSAYASGKQPLDIKKPSLSVKPNSALIEAKLRMALPSKRPTKTPNSQKSRK